MLAMQPLLRHLTEIVIRDVVRHDDIAADHDDLAGGDAIGLRVGEQDLLSERVRQRGPGPGQTTTTG